MTLKSKLAVADAIIEELENLKPGEYIALPTNGLVQFMGKNEDGRMMMYLDVEGIVKKIVEDVFEQVSKH